MIKWSLRSADGGDRVHYRSSLRSIAVLAALILPMVGCANSGSADAGETDQDISLPDISISAFSDISAELNFENATVTTPVDPYMTGASFESEVLFMHARAKLLENCLAKEGFEYVSHKDTDWDSLIPPDDRLFGMWDVNHASKYGSGIDPGRGIPKGKVASEGRDYAAAFDSCATQVNDNDDFRMISAQMEELTIANRIFGNSYRQALASKEGKAVTKKFADCLADKDFVTDPDTGFVSPEYADLGKEEDMASSVAEAECNVSADRIRTLYDLMARYETAYMKEYESQLAAVADKKSETFEALKAIIDGDA